MSGLLRNPWFYVIAFAVVGGAGGLFYAYGSSRGTEYETVFVQRADLREEVDVTGQVKPSEEVDLAFESGGKITVVNVRVGDSVVAGQLLASLDTSELSAQLASANASVASAQSVLSEYERSLAAEEAKLDELKAGTRVEEIEVAQTNADNAKRAFSDAQDHFSIVEAKAAQDLDNLYANVRDILTDAYTKADDAVYKYADEMFSKEFVNKNELIFIVKEQTMKQSVENAHSEAQVAVDAFAGLLISLPQTKTGLDASLRDALAHLQTVQAFLLQLNTALNNTLNLSQTTLTTYKSSVSTARANVNTATTVINSHIQAIASQVITNQQNITSAQNELNAAENTLRLKESELILKMAGALPDQVRGQEARVQQALSVLQTQRARVQQSLAEVDRLAAQLSNFVIRAPFDGVVTNQDVKKGEIVSANTPLITVISPTAFQIEANIPEADIAKVKLDDQARLTLDAYGESVVYAASVLRIDPAQTTVEGVATYKVTLRFADQDERVRSGMTANLIILTGTRTNALSLPQRAVISRNGSRTAQRIVKGEVSEVPIRTGLISADGRIEILEGLFEGDEVVLAVRER